MIRKIYLKHLAAITIFFLLLNYWALSITGDRYFYMKSILLFLFTCRMYVSIIFIKYNNNIIPPPTQYPINPIRY